MKIWVNDHIENVDADDDSLELPIDIQISELKQKLADTDYKAIKYAEGVISEEEYAPIKAERQEWRRQINELESEYGN